MQGITVCLHLISAVEKDNERGRSYADVMVLEIYSFPPTESSIIYRHHLWTHFCLPAIQNAKQRYNRVQAFDRALLQQPVREMSLTAPLAAFPFGIQPFKLACLSSIRRKPTQPVLTDTNPNPIVSICQPTMTGFVHTDNVYLLKASRLGQSRCVLNSLSENSKAICCIWKSRPSRDLLSKTNSKLSDL